MSRFAIALLRRVLDPAERDEVLDDVAHEYATRRSRDGAVAARLWVWRQALGSVPGAFRRDWLRGRTGFVPESERLRGGGGALELRDHLLGPVRPVVLATLAAMAVILLMACANVATLMLAQLRGRASELAVRVALGAGRRRLAQQLLVEAALLALVAGVVGAVAASLGFSVLVAALPLGVLGDVVAADYTLYATSLGSARSR